MPKKDPAKENLRYEVITQEDPVTGDLILPIPQEILDHLEWKESDELEVNINKDGTIFLKRK